MRRSVTQILIAGLSALPATHHAPVSQPTAFTVSRSRTASAHGCPTAGLDVAAVAARSRLSPSTLHRVWPGEVSSLSEWIRAQRLDPARQDLCDVNRSARSASNIAFS
jgi:AraC-like DNA-binding protein